MARKLEIEVVGDSRSLERALGRAQSSSGKLGGALRGLGKIALGAGAVLGGGLAVAAKIGFSEFIEGQKVAAQTAAVIKSTGGAAKVTAAQVSDLSEALMKKSGVDDEAIASGQNMLLTFKQIRNESGKGNDIFNQATKATLDLSVAMGKDMSDSAIMVGKALNDPIRGLTAMRRVGIQFTEAQEKQITAMVESGDVMGAQKVILKELESQFGGSAEAAGKTFGGQMNILKETFSNTAGEIVGRFVPIIVELANWLLPKVTKALDFVFEAITGIIAPFTKASETFGHTGNEAYKAGRRIKDAFDAVWAFIKSNLIPIVLDLRDIFRAAIERIAKVLSDHEPELRRIFGRIGAVIKFLAKIILPILRVAFVEILPRVLAVVITFVDKATFWLGKIITFIRDMRSRIATAVDGIRKFFGPGGQFRAPFSTVIDWIKDRFDGIVDFFRNLPGRMGAAILGQAQRLKDAVFSLLRKALPSWAEDALGISSPSKVFAKIGTAIVDGLIVGMKSKAGDLKNAALDFLGGGIGRLGDIVGITGTSVQEQLISFAKGMGWPVTSAYRPGDPGLHGQGKAIDVDAGGIAQNTQAFFALLSAFGSRINELFFDPIGWYIDEGRRKSGAIGDHMDHVHIGLFDKGGWLAPNSATLAINRTPHWEPVGPPMAGAGGAMVVNFNFPNYVGNRGELMSAMREAVQDYKRGNGGRSPL